MASLGYLTNILPKVLLWVLLSVTIAATADSHLDEWRQAIQSADIPTLERLAPSVSDINAGADRGKTALMVAAAEGAVPFIKHLINLGADVDHRNHANGTALMYTAQYGRMEAARVLITHGAAVNLIGMKGWSALMIAVLKKHIRMVELLLTKGADVDVRDIHGWTPLMRAIEGGDAELIRRLLQVGDINVNAQSNTGTTALHVAAVLDRIEVVRLLLAHAAQTGLKDAEGNTALMLAQQRGYEDIASLLQ